MAVRAVAASVTMVRVEKTHTHTEAAGKGGEGPTFYRS